ncbi:MAG: O-methyltransferase family 3 [Thermoplasmatales archaeon I-plasma]|jgi:Predicted O-methyltransferase|nr:MAG: O-methyltransferase family 3 [Thermoplasmatales archaeon I-plasma]
MDRQIWNDVEDYFTYNIVKQETSLSNALRHQNEEGLPPINVPPTQGKLLYLLAKMINAAKILEIGTLGGYSTLWLAKALPEGGKITTLEINAKHAVISRDNVLSAGFASKVEIIVGPAKKTLLEMAERGTSIFDMIFIDADKENNPEYFDLALRLTGPGTVIVIDNVVRNGRIIEDGDEDPSVIGIRKLIEMAKKDDRIESTAIQTVSGKGYDGFMVVRVKN